jgi:hypothetical protein
VLNTEPSAVAPDARINFNQQTANSEQQTAIGIRNWLSAEQTTSGYLLFANCCLLIAVC